MASLHAVFIIFNSRPLLTCCLVLEGTYRGVPWHILVFPMGWRAVEVVQVWYLNGFEEEEPNHFSAVPEPQFDPNPIQLFTEVYFFLLLFKE